MEGDDERGKHTGRLKREEERETQIETDRQTVGERKRKRQQELKLECVKGRNKTCNYRYTESNKKGRRRYSSRN